MGLVFSDILFRHILLPVVLHLLSDAGLFNSVSVFSAIVSVFFCVWY